MVVERGFKQNHKSEYLVGKLRGNVFKWLCSAL